MRAHKVGRQVHSYGDSSPEIHRAALAATDPRPGLAWLDIGCGTGALLRMVLRFSPRRLIGVDIIDWLDNDLRHDVELLVGPAERIVQEHGYLVDRVLLVETIEHVEAPWSLLRAAARRVAPGGRIVVTTPNVMSFRHRVELLLRGRLTAFRPDNLPHMTPVLPHVVERVLSDEGMALQPLRYVGRDVVPWTRGRAWPRFVQRRAPRATSVSVVILADRPTRAGAV